jgi:hypothetical protein
LAIEDRDNNLYRTYFNTSPIPQEERKSGFDANRYAVLQGYDNTQLVLNTTKRVDILNKELAIQQIIRLYFKISQRENYCLPFLPFSLSGMKT